MEGQGAAVTESEQVNPIKLAISVCSNRPMEPRCAIAFSMLIHYLTAMRVPFALMCRLQASLLPQARQDVLDEALQDGCTHQLCFDDDMEPPGDCVLRMLQSMHQNPQIDILCVNYCRKQDTLQYTAEDMDGKMMESYGKMGLEEASKAGMGLMLIKLEKLKSIPAPHFEVTWNREYKKYLGEDRYFIEKVRSAGLRLFVDHGISNYTQHWGSIGYNFNLWNPKKNSVSPYATLDVGMKSENAV